MPYHKSYHDLLSAKASGIYNSGSGFYSEAYLSLEMVNDFRFILSYALNFYIQIRKFFFILSAFSAMDLLKICNELSVSFALYKNVMK